MSTYKELVGKKIKRVTSDPSDSIEGQMWYNTTTGTIRGLAVIEATSSSANLNTARAMCSGGGIQTASWICGGSTGSPTVGTTHTENYNGTGWSTQGNLSNIRAHFGATGVQTAGLAVAGGPPFAPSPGGAQNNVEEYDGEAWTGGGAIPTNVWTNGCFGTQTAAVSVGSEPNGTNYVFEYDGSSWTNGGTMNAIRSYVGTAGTLTAGMVFAGLGSPPFASDTIATELYDGTNWTTAPNLSTANTYSPFSGGSQTAAIKAGGIVTPAPPGSSAVIERYDGSSWSTSPATLATARGYSKGQNQNSSSNTAAVFAGGSTTYSGNDSVASTEEFNSSTNVITAAAWASGGSLGTARDSGGSAGTQTAALYFGGYLGSLSAHTESYNGTSWSELNDLNTAKRQVLQGLGTQTAALAFGGLGAPGVSTQLSGTESWNGSSWTALSSPSNQNTAKHNLGSVGTQTAGLKFGGNASYSSATESWNGSAWTTKNSLNTGRTGIRGSGTSTAAIGIGGSSPTIVASVESWDGTNWTASPYSLNTANYVMGCAGPSQTAALIFGGITPVNPVAAISEIFDGSTFSTSPNLATQRYNLGGCGTVSAALAFGGQAPPYSNATEEFTPESTTANIGNFTTS